MSPPIGKRPRREEDRAPASEVIAAIEDLLTEILVRLPVKSLLRFKSVSKYWLSLISSPHFCVLKSKLCSKHIRGILLRKIHSYDPKFDFIPLDPGQIAPFERLNFVEDEKGRLDVIQYCNGLLLCSSSRRGDPFLGFSFSRKAEFNPEFEYYVFNPTTRQHTTVPVNRILDSGKVSRPYIVNLAFDPRISPHFKLFCGYMTRTPGLDPEYHYEIGVYSSETGLVRQIDDPFHTNVDLLNLNTWALYWNGAINWIAHKYDSLYFNFDAECIGILPMPPMPDITEGVQLGFMEAYGRYVRYFGESNDHLHLIQTNINLTAQFNVYELDKEYSGWFVKFRVDLQPVFRSFPEAFSNHLHPLHSCYYSFGILSVVEKVDDEMSYLVLSVRGKAIQFNLKDGSFIKMCDFTDTGGIFRILPLYDGHDSIPLAESLHPL